MHTPLPLWVRVDGWKGASSLSVVVLIGWVLVESTAQGQGKTFINVSMYACISACMLPCQLEQVTKIQQMCVVFVSCLWFASVELILLLGGLSGETWGT